jgi:hypothetical protein
MSSGAFTQNQRVSGAPLRAKQRLRIAQTNVHLVYPSTTYRASLSRASRPLAKACHAARAQFFGIDKQSAAILNSSGKVAYMSAARF